MTNLTKKAKKMHENMNSPSKSRKWQKNDIKLVFDHFFGFFIRLLELKKEYRNTF